MPVIAHLTCRKKEAFRVSIVNLDALAPACYQYLSFWQLNAVLRQFKAFVVQW